VKPRAASERLNRLGPGPRGSLKGSAEGRCARVIRPRSSEPAHRGRGFRPLCSHQIERSPSKAPSLAGNLPWALRNGPRSAWPRVGWGSMAEILTGATGGASGQLREMSRVPLTEWIYMIREAGNGWLEDQAQRLGASLAFYTLLSLAPLLVITVALAGLVFGREAAEGQLAWQVQNLVGLDEARGLQAIVQSAQKPAVGLFATMLSLATIAFSASSAAADLQNALNTIWHVASPPARGLLANLLHFAKSRFSLLVLVLGGGVVMLASAAFSTWIAALGKFFHPLPIPEAVLHSCVFLFSFLVITLIFAVIYKILPDVRLAWTDVIVGACVSSLLFTIGKQLIALYLGKVGIGSAYGAAGSLVVVLIWVYYSAQLFFLGAEFTKVYALTRGSHRTGLKNRTHVFGRRALPRN